MILSIASFACERQHSGTTNQTDQELLRVASYGPAFKKALIKRIGQSDSITITEQSDWTDFIPRASMEEAPRTEKDAPKYDYRSVCLSKLQISAFLYAAEGMEEATDDLYTFCGFQPHHRIDFQSGEDSSSMVVCFECDGIEWKDADFKEPKGLFPVLKMVIEGSGLSIVRDWPQMAIERREQDAASNR